MKTRHSLTFCLLLAFVSGAGCKTAKVTAEREYTPAQSTKPVMIYVADFELSATGVKHQDGALSGRSGPVGRVGNRLSGASGDPAARARQIVDLMASTLVKDLSKVGFNAVRFPAGTPIPAQGWLLRGVFTEVQEGNRVRRAMVGFGEGQTDIQLIATVHDLSQGAPKPLYEVATDASSGSTTPGAGATLALNPYAAGARFVMAGKDLEKNLK